MEGKVVAPFVRMCVCIPGKGLREGGLKKETLFRDRSWVRYHSRVIFIFSSERDESREKNLNMCICL